MTLIGIVDPAAPSPAWPWSNQEHIAALPRRPGTTSRPPCTSSTSGRLLPTRCPDPVRGAPHYLAHTWLIEKWPQRECSLHEDCRCHGRSARLQPRSPDIRPLGAPHALGQTFFRPPIRPPDPVPTCDHGLTVVGPEVQQKMSSYRSWPYLSLAPSGRVWLFPQKS